MELERLQVVIEASTSNFKKKMNAIKDIMNSTSNDMKKMTNTVDTKGIDKLNNKISDTKSKLADLYAQMDEIKAKKNAGLSEMPFSTDAQLDAAVESSLSKDKTYQKLKNSIRDVEFELEKYKATLTETGRLQSNNTSKTNKFAEALNRIKDRMRGVRNDNKRMNLGLKETIQQTVPLSRSFFRMSNMLKLMALRMVMRATLNAVKSGFNDLAKANTGFNNTMSALQGSFLQARNALATAFAPALQALTPVIIAVANAFITAFNAIGMFTSRLFGNSSTFIKATKVSTDYAKSLGGTANAAKKAGDALARFDEINNLNRLNAETTGMPDASQMFEEVLIPEDKLIFIDRIGNALDFITTKAKEMGSALKRAFEVDDEVKREMPEALKNLKDSFIELQAWYNNLPTVIWGNDMAEKLAETIFKDFDKKINKWLNKTLKNTKLELDRITTTIDIFLGAVTFDGEKLSKGLQQWGANYVKSNRGILSKLFDEAVIDELVKTLEEGRLWTEMQKWWDKNVAPYFTSEKWHQMALSGYLGIGGAFATWNEGDWSNRINAWWNQFVAPYFTSEKWQKLSKNGYLGLSGMLFTWSKEDWKKGMDNWINNYVKPYFAANKWADMAKNAWISLQKGFADVINSIIDMFNKIQFRAPDWIPGVGGKTWGVNIPPIKLATGGVITSPTLAMVGEYAGANTNPEIVAPSDLLRRIVREESGNGNFDTSEIVSLLGNLIDVVRQGKVIAIDGNELISIVNKGQSDSFRSLGKTTIPI